MPNEGTDAVNRVITYSNLYSHEQDVYSLPGFTPQIIDEAYLSNLGVQTLPSPETLSKLTEGSRIFLNRYQKKTVIPISRAVLTEVDYETYDTTIHNYTGRCPTLTFEINPVVGCNVGCQYCLVTDGVHEQEIKILDNYHLYVRKLLKEMNGTPTANVTKEDLQEKNRLLAELARAIESAPEKKLEIERKITELSKGKNWNHYYYFSPKTEALQEPTLVTGLAHRILREFIEHFKEYPDSNARLFIASKAGIRHLMAQYEGESLLDLFKELKDKMQYNVSVSIMPSEYRNILEPYAAPIEDRLKAVDACRENGILSDSALVQPIFTPYLTQEHIKEFFDNLHAHGIINYKPEFLTACMENLAMLGQWLGYFDKQMEKALYEDYIMPSNADHKKQRGRTAPDRALSLENIEKMKEYTDSIGMTTSICYWVRKQLQISNEVIPVINENGYQCLGYQSGLFIHE